MTKDELEKCRLNFSSKGTYAAPLKTFA